jgi:hypothetical protein
MNVMPLAALTVALASLGLAACGGGEGDGGAAKADYIARADAICKRANVRIHARAVKVGRQSSAVALAKFQKALASDLDRELLALRALGPPKGDAGKVSAIYDTIEAGKKKMSRAEPLEIPYLRDPFLKNMKTARAYGLKQCGGIRP